MDSQDLAKLIKISTFEDHRGGLFVVENNFTICPFEIKRIYVIHNVPSQEIRAGHAHKQLNQMIVAASGSFRIKLNDGTSEFEFLLSSPKTGLLIKPGLWRELYGFSRESTCMVFADQHYDKEDYINDFESFKKWKKTIS
jgi:dTDP-4-dehydrorhamnose 3,5-epimerase-like enzyme